MVSPEEIEKKYYLVKDLEHFSIFTEKRKQNLLMLD